ncbi:hypothetical protein Q4599_11045 [Cellulophaga lytica]|uniref:hypothetical protein n=1 Tax=Cellulophaga lytica TaxID=979 RepID=UPI0026E2C0F7|nr:hypothetical protein [Cellulophaga lytica]MDO6854116.1 hypothetical protein [Cellulophaga lytica]
MKKIHKTVKFSFLLMAFCLAFSCSEEDDYEPPYGDFSSLTIWTSFDYDENEEEKRIVALNKYVAFNDLSRGIVSHQWEIENGMHFMNSNFTAADTLNYDRFIKANAGQTSTDNLVYVLFTELGEKNIRLVNTYKDSVAESVKSGDVWKVDKTITVTVLEE